MNENIDESIGLRIKNLRNSHNETQNDLAKVLFVSQNAISKIEKGESSLSVEKLMLLSEHYNVSIDFLCKGTNSESIVNLLSHIFSIKNNILDLDYNEIYCYPTLEVNKTFFSYLLNMHQIQHLNNMPETLKQEWRKLELDKMNTLLKDKKFGDTESIIPLPQQFLFDLCKSINSKPNELIYKVNNIINNYNILKERNNG